MFPKVFAHAGETHETVTAATTHSLFSQWYVILPLYILSLCLIAYVAYRLSRKSLAFTYNLMLAILLIAGMLGYTRSAPVSVISLSVGFAMALLQVMIGLGRSSPKKPEVDT
jgi:hypothetical protein